MLSYQLKPHFEEMIKQHQLRTSRTGAMNIEPFGFAQGELFLPLANSIIENWKIGTFDPEIFIRKAETHPTNYVF